MNFITQLNKFSKFLGVALFIFFGFNSIVLASPSSGTIDSTSYQTRICQDSSCSVFGTINFRSTTGTSVTITDSGGIDGNAWGNQISWIDFDPAGPEGVSINPATGALSGKAWSGGSGWINFRPSNAGTISLGIPVGVSITANGEFYGWAWTGGPHGGWIRFDCSDSNTCVKTDWRPLSNRPGGSGGGSTGDPVDVCFNLQGVQTSVPQNYVLLNGQCVLNVDYCTNIPRTQTSVPSGYSVNSAGECIIDTDEIILPIDTIIPVTEISEPTDRCLNIPGIQAVVPVGYIISLNNTCIPQETDYCPNIPGNQVIIPEQHQIDDEGNCVLELSIQEPIEPLTEELRDTSILALPFVPDTLQIPVIGSKIFSQLQNREYVDSIHHGFDLLSLGILAIVGIGILWWFVLLFRYNLAGVVYDQKTKDPVKQSALKVFRINDEEKKDFTLVKDILTNDEGEYEFRLKKGSYFIEAETENHQKYVSETLKVKRIKKLRHDIFLNEIM